MAGTTAAAAAAPASSSASQYQASSSKRDADRARPRPKSTFHVFLAPSLGDAAPPRKGTKLVKISGSRISKRVATSASADGTSDDARAQKENAAPAPRRLDKGKQKQVDVPVVETSMSAFFPRPPPVQTGVREKEEAFLRAVRPAGDHDAASANSSASSGRPTPTPAEAAALRLATRNAPNATSQHTPSSADMTSPGVGRGIPPGEQYESRLDQPTSWTDTFMQGLDAHEADLTARDRDWVGPFSIGTTCTGRALQCDHPHEEGLLCKEPAGEGYVSGHQAEQSIGRALRAESEVRQMEENREAILRQAREDDDGLSIWPISAREHITSAMSAHGRDKSTNRVRFVSAKHALASTQMEGHSRQQHTGQRTRPLLEIIPSRQATQQTTSSRHDSPVHESDSETEEEEELVLTTPRHRKTTSSSIKLPQRAGQSSSRINDDRDASREHPRDQSSARAGTWVRDVSRRNAQMTPPDEGGEPGPSHSKRCESCGCNGGKTRRSSPQPRNRHRPHTPAEMPSESPRFEDRSRNGATSHVVAVEPPQTTLTTRKPVCKFTFTTRAASPATNVSAAEKVCRVDTSNISMADASRRGVKRVRSDPTDSTSENFKTKTLRRVGSDGHRPVPDRSVDRSARDTSYRRDKMASSHSASANISPQSRGGGSCLSSAAPKTDAPGNQSASTSRASGSKVVAMDPQSDRSVSAPRAPAPSRPLPACPSRPPLVPSKLAQSFTAESLERSEPSLLSETQGGTQGESNASSTNATGLDSIPPPPTLNFDAHTITPISTILSTPQRFLSARNGGPRDQPSAPRINLLALVREVGPLEEVGTKVYKNGKVVEGAVNMTFRSELVLMDSGGSMLKVCIWGDCAQQWAGGFESSQGSDDDDDAGLATQSMDAGRTVADITTFSALMRPGAVERRDRAKKICPALQAGDVISLESIIISLRRSGNDAGDVSMSITAANQQQHQQQMQIQGSASERTKSRAELCWRWHTKNAREQRKYTFDPVLSTFDRRCKEVWKCAQRWDRTREG